MSVTQEQILKALTQVNDPDLNRDIVSLGFVKHVKIEDGNVSFAIELTTPACPVRDQMKEQAIQSVRAIPGVKQVEVTMASSVRSSILAQAAQRLVPTIKNIVSVASGKGGVGKSTVSANLALALAKTGARVGLMDADVYGPSIPTILGITESPQVTEERRMIPVQHQGLKVISMAFFMKPEEAVIWRGPMLHKTVEQFLGGVEWGELDYLLVDLPPGCLTADTLVPTDHGMVPITEVREGFLVYSFDGHFNKSGARSPRELHAALVRRKVLRVIPQGKAQVWELRTMTRSIRGTADHPVLVVCRRTQPHSRYLDYSFEWRELARIQPGEVVVAVKKLPQNLGRPLALPPASANGRSRVRIPTHSSDDKLGLKQHVLEKIIPAWAFALPTTQKLALIEGYCDADGYRRMARVGHRRAGWMCFESPNKRLMEGLRALCMDVGLKAGNLNSRTRRIRLPSTGRIMTSTFYAFEANRTAKTDRYGAGLIRGPRVGKGLQHEYVGFERVKEVRSAGSDEVYDLQVEDKHNFVANGFVVHNTGDVQLSLCQIIPLTGAAIVSTPQDVALNVAHKAIAMFKKLNAPVLGIIENMSYHVCPTCGTRDDIFGSGGAKATAERMSIPFLGAIPLDTKIRETSDAGTPIVLSDPGSSVAKAFTKVAENLAAQVSIRGMQGELAPQPKVTF